MARYTCNVCRTSFHRGEHLLRHQRSHEGQRPFACPQCDLAFSRRDTLQRHLAVHEKNANPGGPLATATRSRVKAACQTCSQSKLRCDGNHPCARCTSKGSTCRYVPSKTPAKSRRQQHDETQQQSPESDVNRLAGPRQSGNSTAVWTLQQNDHNGESGLQFPMDVSTNDASFQSNFNVINPNGQQPFAAAPSAGELDLSALPEASHHDQMQTDEPVFEIRAPDLQPFDTCSFDVGAPHLAFWEDPEFMVPLQQDFYVTYDHLPTSEQSEPTGPAQVHAGAGADDSASDSGSTPVPTFLGARSSPEPQDGQGFRFADFISKAWPDQTRKRELARGSQTGEIRHAPPLMGAFSSILSAAASDHIWESENLAHVRSLPPETYHQIVDNFSELNITNRHYNRFAAGAFPSLAACNAFMQLFFEEFNLLFPLIHQPSFDPAGTPWLLVLAVMAVGCRFSRQSAAVECADILQEFLRRAFQVTIEKKYDSTSEPWLAQSGLLNQIGMQFSEDFRLTQVGQSIRSLIASICRKVNCFRGLDGDSDSAGSELSYTEAWKRWAHRESMCRLAYSVWLVDSQYALFHDLPTIIPIELVRVRLPCSESLWRAPTATSWWKCLHENGAYQPLNIRQELSYLYRTGTRRQGLGDFTVLLLVMGVFRSALRVRQGLHESAYLQPGAIVDSPHYGASKSTPRPKSYTGNAKAMEYLQVLCSDDEETPRLSSLRSSILHHYHTIGIIFGISLGELFCYCGFRVTSEEMSRSRNRLQTWIQQEGTEARRVALHAGRLFGSIRQSNMLGYYEGRAFMIACQSLWIYGELAKLDPGPLEGMSETENGQLDTPTVRLDQCLNKHCKQAWLLNGTSIRPYLAGVGCILDVDGVARLIQEGSRVLCDTRTWGFCPVMGKALRLWHMFRTQGIC